MRFGFIKTAIEKKLTKSFVNETISEDMRTFKKLVLTSPSIKKMYYIYDKLNESLGIDKESAEMMVDELIKEAKSIEIPHKNIILIAEWVDNNFDKTEYNDIDNLIYSKLTLIEDKVESKKNIIESLMVSKKMMTESKTKLPISSLLKIADNTAKKYLSSLDESVQKEVVELLKSDKTKLSENFKNEQKIILEKLDSLKKLENEESVIDTLNETIQKIKNTEFSTIELVKLKELNKTLIS
jgi:hypothetical protein